MEKSNMWTCCFKHLGQSEDYLNENVKDLFTREKSALYSMWSDNKVHSLLWTCELWSWMFTSNV